MNNWDKVEKRKKKTTFTRGDELYEYFKLFILIAMALAYMYVLYF